VGYHQFIVNLFDNICCRYSYIQVYFCSFFICIRGVYLTASHFLYILLKIFFVTNQTMLESSLDWLSTQGLNQRLLSFREGGGDTASVIVVWGSWFIPHLDAGWETTMKNYLSPLFPLWQILRRWETNGSWGCESWNIQHSIRRIISVCLVVNTGKHVFLIPEKEIVKEYVNLITISDIIRVRIYYSVLKGQ